MENHWAEGKKLGILNSSSSCHWFPNGSGQVTSLCQMSEEIFKVLMVQESRELCRIGRGPVTVPSLLWFTVQDSPLPVSQSCSRRVCISSCPHSGTASFCLSFWLTHTRAHDLLTSVTQLPELIVQRLLAPVLALVMLTAHTVSFRPFSSLSRHQLR